jgi:hypothetical protein
VTATTSARSPGSSGVAFATSGRSTPLLTSDADDTTADASLECFSRNIHQATAPTTIRHTSSSHSNTLHEMAVVVQDLNKRAEAFNAEREESMRANQMKVESGTTHSDALSTARTVPRETDVMASHTYGGDIHHAPTCRTSPLRSSPPTNVDGNDSNARESSKQAVNSK